MPPHSLATALSCRGSPRSHSGSVVVAAPSAYNPPLSFRSPFPLSPTLRPRSVPPRGESPSGRAVAPKGAFLFIGSRHHHRAPRCRLPAVWASGTLALILASNVPTLLRPFGTFDARGLARVCSCAPVSHIRRRAPDAHSAGRPYGVALGRRVVMAPQSR